MKPLLGPPVPNRLVVEARTALETSADPIEVVAATLMLRDLLGPVPTGGGILWRNGRVWATDIIDALTLRGFLGAPRRRRSELVHPRLFGGDDGAT